MGEAQSFIWYALMTTDTAAAKALYRTVVGWEMRAFGGVGLRTS
jgi:predicted enzyme related to lactoylglutathione lyase